MELGGERVLSLRIMLVDFPLQRIVCFGIGEETEKYACEGARGRIRSRDDGEYTIVDEVPFWRRRSGGLIFIVLCAGSEKEVP